MIRMMIIITLMLQIQVNPPYYVRLVEVVPSPWTHPDIREKTKAIMTEIGQKPVVFSKEIDGFALNRIQYVIGRFVYIFKRLLSFKCLLTLHSKSYRQIRNLK